MKSIFTKINLFKVIVLIGIFMNFVAMVFIRFQLTQKWNNNAYNGQKRIYAQTAPTTFSPNLSIPCGIVGLAFCDDFSESPNLLASRSGDLDPSEWSVARLVQPYQSNTSNVTNSLDEYPSVPIASCRAGVNSIIPENDTLICDSSSVNNKELMTATKAQNYSLNSYRPEQQFDFTNRTGKVVFDVDAATAGALDKFINIFITDEPLSGANYLETITGLAPKNGVGIDFANQCGANYQEVGVSGIYEFNNYIQSNIYQSQGNGPCVQTQIGKLNHFEIRISQNNVEVWGSDYTTNGGNTFPNFQLLQSFPINLAFSKGYVHYQMEERASEKYLNIMNLNYPYAVYHWKNLGFDGPIIAPDRDYQVPDALTNGPDPGFVNLGYEVLNSINGISQGMFTCCSFVKIHPLNINNVDISNATGAKLAFDAFVEQNNIDLNTLKIQYRLNSGTWRDLNPIPPYNTLLNQTCGCPATTGNSWSVAVSTIISLSDLKQGTNTLEFTSFNANQSFPIVVDNIDLIVSTDITPTPPITLAIPTIDSSVPLNTYSSAITLNGTKDAIEPSIMVNNSTTNVNYSDSTHWSVSENLVMGMNSFSIHGMDSANNMSTPVVININRHAIANIKGSGVVDLTDLSIFAKDWNRGKAYGTTLYNPLSDLNGDGSVDLADLSILAKNWGI